ncbi:KpsF/GutQ family sugar-phosphate isomerase [Desulfocicer vacuolatum]|nr:KpsF/GutQ family sugar-phosphate isomerase [Desulfocicer vacuolatum]
MKPKQTMATEKAVEVLELEAKSILNLTHKIGEDFDQMVDEICNASGRVIISGIGKSGLIGRKIVATLSSTGTNAMFLHPVEAMHGDLGMVSPKDVFIAISNSGETGELNLLLPSIRDLGCIMIAFTGNPNSTMAGFCSLIIDTGVEKEACPLGLAPTCSTTAQLAMGDALAVVLIHKKQFRKSDFKRSHPGGALGKRLSFPVGEIMYTSRDIPRVPPEAPLPRAVAQMDKFRLGAVFVLDHQNALEGILTDGDIRHLIAMNPDTFTQLYTKEVMTENPCVITADAPLYQALNIMEKRQITILPVTDAARRVVGILHLHDILGKGAFTFSS